MGDYKKDRVSRLLQKYCDDSSYTPSQLETGERRITRGNYFRLLKEIELLEKELQIRDLISASIPLGK